MMIANKARELFRRSILNKLVISYIIIILIPISVITYFSYSKLVANTKTMYFNDNVEFLKTVEKSLQLYFEDFDRLTYNTISSDNLLEMLKTENSDEFAKVQNGQIYEKVAWNIFGDRDDVEGVYLVSHAMDIFYKSSYGNIELEGVLREPWFRTLEESRGSFFIFGSHRQAYKTLPESGYVLTVGRKMIDYHTRHTMGIVFIDLKPNVFKRLFQGMDKDERNIIIIDGNNNIIYDTNENNITQKFSSSYPGLNLTERRSDGGMFRDGDNFILLLHSEKLNWTFVETVSANKLLKRTTDATLPIFVVSIICLIIFLLVSFWISGKIARPIKALENTMKKVEKGDLNQKVSLNCGGEVESLAVRFNKMLEEIKNLISKVYESRLHEMDAEYKALQAQINPHFLYNTLESISSLADIKGYEDIPEMVQGLARMFRYSIKKDNKFVSLEDELNHVKDYILLQALRYENSFEIVYDIPDELLEARIVKLALQPIVENAICHGIENVDRKGLIKLQALSADDRLIILISDNGKGMGRDRLQEIIGQLHSPMENISSIDYSKTSIGILNIHLRIRLLFGDSYGLSMESEEYKGTTVRLEMPLEKIGGLYA